MTNMNETQIHQEADEIADSNSFSLVAILGFILSSAGVFSVGYINMVPVAILGCMLGAFALVTAKRFRLNLLSKFLGFIAVVVGATAASWGVSERSIETSGDLTQARRIAELYLESLSANDLEKVYYLVGFQFEGESSSEREAMEASQIQRSKSRLEMDPAHLEIRNRKSPAKWEFVSIDGEFPGTMGWTYRLRYRDGSQTIPSEYWVYARKNCGKYESRERVRWFVDNLETVKKPQ
ncbi:MAG: hypothetical protein MUF23_16540 [Pirellula sp.]|jgi:hypothetical protein|nr:hypothetical protein [Pirellula sp.]